MPKNSIYDKMKTVISDGSNHKTYLADDDFIQVRYCNILLSYHLNNPLIDLPQLLSTIRRISIKLTELLQIREKQIGIEIFHTRDQWIDQHTVISDHDLPTWIMGDSGRVIRLLLEQDKITDFKELQLMVTHETIHFIIRSFCPPVPAWLDEGLAVHLSQNLPDEYRQILDNALLKQAVLPLELLAEPFTRLDRDIKNLAYAQSASLVEYLLEKYGWPQVKELLISLAQGNSLAVALRFLGLNEYLLEKEWLREVTDKKCHTATD